MPRFASIDIGTNSVLLLVAEPDSSGKFQPVLERAEITRLGRGVDRSRQLAPEAIADTLAVLESFANDARKLGVEGFAVSATSAARDSSNGQDFIDQVFNRTELKIEIIPGDEEARLSFASANADFGNGKPLVVLDIGGGSTEFIYGAADGRITFRHSFNVGSVRMTERVGEDREKLTTQLRETFSTLPAPEPGFTLVAVAGTATTVCAVSREIDPYDSKRVHGAVMPVAEVTRVIDRLYATPLEQRRTLKGLQPKRADVIPAGATILAQALAKLGATQVTISDRGLRWGLLVDRFGGAR